MFNEERNILVPVLAIIFCVILAYATWAVARKINYSLSYKSQVESTVKMMVKSECLNIKEKL